MSDLFDDMTLDGDKGQKVKSNEITGDRFQFHSLPKEFQDWHNVYYILEKEGGLDKNIVSKAILNGYMWKTIGDGSTYGIAAAVATISAVVKWKLTSGLAGFIFTAVFYFPFMFFIAYHFIFYAMIRAQVVGTVTKESANATTYTFYATFFGVYLSLMAAFVFLIAIARDVLILIFTLIHKIHGNEGNPNTYMSYFENSLIWIHNKIVELFISGGTLMDNIYFLTFLSVLASITLIYWFDNKYYKQHVVEIQKEVEKTRNSQGYPIETAQKIITGWRKRNGM